MKHTIYYINYPHSILNITQINGHIAFFFKKMKYSITWRGVKKRLLWKVFS